MHLPRLAPLAAVVVLAASDPAAAFAEIGRVLRPGGEARIYDLRFAGFGPDEARRLAVAAGLGPDPVDHRVVDGRVFGLRPYSLIAIER